MPLVPSLDDQIMKVINLMGAILYPLSLCLLLPVFIYQITLEKETKLLEIMKMNGLRMRNYWFINFIFNFILYFITIVVFIVFGWLILGLNFFSDTSWVILGIFFLGWGLC